MVNNVIVEPNVGEASNEVRSPNPQLAVIATVQRGLRQRAKTARWTSLAALSSIVLVVAAGALGFVWASSFVAADVTTHTRAAKEAIEKVVKEGVSAQGSIKDWKTSIESSQKSVRAMAAALGTDSGLAKLREAEKRKAESARQGRMKLETVTADRAKRAADAAKLAGDIASLESELKMLEGSVSAEAQSYVSGLHTFAHILRNAPDADARKRLTADQGNLDRMASRHKTARESLARKRNELTALKPALATEPLPDVDPVALENAAAQRLQDIASWQQRLDEGAASIADAIGELSADLQSREATITEGAQSLTASLAKVEDMGKRMPEEFKGGSETVLLVSVLLTRSAIAVLVFFLAQILLGLYRYNARLEHYFLGRADALAMLGSSVAERTPELQESLFRMMNILSAQTVDFGRLPNSPTRDAVELASAMLKGKAD